MFRKILATIALLAVVTSTSFAGPKTSFSDGNPAQGIKGTKVTSDFLNKTSYEVPTGENVEGSSPLLYSADTGTINAYVVNLTQGKKRATGTNTSTSTNKLIDSGATFQTAGTVIGDVVLDITDGTTATVASIDSQTQLTVSSNIFTATGKSYAVGPNIQQLPQSYTTGLVVSFVPTMSNTFASTININSLGVKTITKNGSALLLPGDIPAGQIVTLVYNGTNMQLISPSVSLVTDVGVLLPSTLPSAQYWNAAAYGAGRFVAVGGNPVATGAYSTNGGQTWTGTTLPSSQTWRGVAYGNGRFVSVATGTTAAYSSDGGVTWTVSSLPSSRTWYGVAYGNGKFVAVAGDTGTYAAYSTDGGATWTASTLPISQPWYSVAYGAGRFVAVGGNAGTGSAYSPDGINWTAGGALPTSQLWMGIAYGNGRFVTVGGSPSAAAAYSSDGGATWSATTMPSGQYWRGMAYGNGRFFTMGAGPSNTAAFSTDGGTTWTAATLPSSQLWAGPAYGNGSFVGVVTNAGATAGTYVNTTLTLP